MSDFLTRLAERALGLTPTAQARVPHRFGDAPELLEEPLLPAEEVPSERQKDDRPATASPPATRHEIVAAPPDSAVETPLRVHIGRIDVRSSAAVPPRAKRVGPRLSLADYLRQRRDER